MTTLDFDGALKRLLHKAKIAQDFRQKLEMWASTQPQTVQCDKHEQLRKIDFDASSKASFGSAMTGEPEFTLIYGRCPECEREEELTGIARMMSRIGVPLVLINARFDNYKPQTSLHKHALFTARRFAKAPKGVLVMRGHCGTGKSHLAAAIVAELLFGCFITQRRLITKLREGYGAGGVKDKTISGMVGTRLLVLDDFGTYSGARDEFYAIDEILCERHAEKKPTVITSNLTKPQFYDALGERMGDRLSEGTFADLEFDGHSYRQSNNNTYLHETS